jgi:endonuclease-3
MANAPKTDGLEKAIKTILKKPAARGDSGDAGPRPVLEELVYGLCREGATPAAADAAFARLKKDFYDWNEVRVSTVPEIATAMKGLPDVGVKAQRLLAFLQELFELDYNFSLEGIEKKGFKHAAKQLARYPGVNDFTIAWVTQRSFGGHAIPVDSAAMRALARLNALDEGDTAEVVRSRLEHAISKADGIAFTDALAEYAASVVEPVTSEPEKPKVKKPKPKTKSS